MKKRKKTKIGQSLIKSMKEVIRKEKKMNKFTYHVGRIRVTTCGCYYEVEVEQDTSMKQVEAMLDRKLERSCTHCKN